MKRALVLVLLLPACFSLACKKSSNTPSSSTASSASASRASSDAIEQKLQELAGKGAADCGRVKSQESAAVQPASDCALKSAEVKQPFYVAYELPGLTTAVAGNAQGNLFAVQAQTSDASSPKVESTPCPAALRLAQSGRVTCYPAGSMGGMGTPSGGSPHSNMSMPTAGGQSPHGASVPSAAPAPSHGKPTNPH
jgi:hypothetical protein